MPSSRSSRGRTSTRKITIAEIGCPGKPEDRHAPVRADDRRLARAHGDPVEEQPRLAEALDDRPGQIARTRRTAAGDQHQVGSRHRAPHQRQYFVGVVADAAEQLRIAAEVAHPGAERVLVDVADATGAGLLLRPDQFVPGGDDRHPRTPGDGNLRDPEAREQSDVGRAQHVAAGQHPLPFAHVLADGDEVLPRGNRPVDLENVAALARVLPHHDRVGPAGEHPARGDPQRVAGADPPLGRGAHDHAAANRQVGRLRLGGAEGVGGGDGVPVHDRPGEVRHVDRGQHVAGERAPERVEDRDRFGGGGPQPRKGVEDLTGPRDLEKTGGSAALVHVVDQAPAPRRETARRRASVRC